MKEPTVTCVSAVHDKGTEFMRKYIEMTKIFEPYKPKQTIQIKGVMSNVSREQYDKLCKGGRSNG